MPTLRNRVVIFCNLMLKVMDLEDELKMIGENLKALEVAEEKALIMEEKYLVWYEKFFT